MSPLLLHFSSLKGRKLQSPPVTFRRQEWGWEQGGEEQQMFSQPQHYCLSSVTELVSVKPQTFSLFCILFILNRLSADRGVLRHRCVTLFAFLFSCSVLPLCTCHWTCVIKIWPFVKLSTELCFHSEPCLCSGTGLCPWCWSTNKRHLFTVHRLMWSWMSSMASSVCTYSSVDVYLIVAVLYTTSAACWMILNELVGTCQYKASWQQEELSVGTVHQVSSWKKSWEPPEGDKLMQSHWG